ncbi:energy transducer TonB [Maribellus sediminis]|uniref:energy transducer TonB n=1 Tax=Maribellus sediminis TaxID=2696285 RepID=UPI0014322740|nr:energy transducer TonB [Maribellus sediminis]
MMKTALFLILFTFAAAFAVSAQDTGKEKVYDKVEIMPEYPGGQEALLKFISENVKYPENAIKNEIQGKVFVNFIIDESGAVTKVKVLRGVDDDIDKEAVRVIKLLEKWTPGKEKGKAVKVKYTLPINFALS